jgi:hypothetical protein
MRVAALTIAALGFFAPLGLGCHLDDLAQFSVRAN